MSVRKEKKEYAIQQVIMLMLFLLFFGVMVIPHFYKQMEYASYQKTEGMVKTILYSQYAPTFAFVEIMFKMGDKDYLVKETVHQHLQVGDHVEIYVSPNKKSIQFQKPSMVMAVLFLVVYFLLLLGCAYCLYQFYKK